VIKVIKNKEDNLAKPANSVIKTKDRNMVKPTEEACPCLPSLARETFVPDKDNKSKVKFVQHINTAKNNNNLTLTLV
jgi:hypothetical protein